MKASSGEGRICTYVYCMSAGDKVQYRHVPLSRISSKCSPINCFSTQRIRGFLKYSRTDVYMYRLHCSVYIKTSYFIPHTWYSCVGSCVITPSLAVAGGPRGPDSQGAVGIIWS